MPLEDITSDVAIVGGGPAGLVAAGELARLGATVTLLDENEHLGGQYYKPRPPALAQRDGMHRPRGARLIAAADLVGAHLLTGTLVWGVGDDGRTLLVAHHGTEALEVVPTVTVVATGAYERAIPFPGWELPGVVTPGLALHMAACDRVAVGKRVVVAGTGPFLLVAAVALLEVGAHVCAVVEHNRPYHLANALVGAAHPARSVEALRYRSVLARHRVPLLQGWRVKAAIGGQRLQAVHITSADGNDERWFTADALAVGFGFRPSTELVQLLGAEGSVSPLGDFVPALAGTSRTSVKGVYVAGEVAGVAGAVAAEARGVLAAAEVASDLGLGGVPEVTVRRARRLLARQLRLARTIERLFPVTPDDYRRVPDEALVCRCEGVIAAEVRAAAGLGWNDTGSLKGATRAGMGPCQGRFCGPAIHGLTASHGESGQRPVPVNARMPIKPVPWLVLATSRAGADGPGDHSGTDRARAGA